MTREHVINTAKLMIDRNGIINLTRQNLSKKAGIPDGSFIHIVGCSFTELLNELDDKPGGAKLKHRQRVDPNQRKQLILTTAVKICERVDYSKLTSSQIADKLKISRSLINRYFGSIGKLRREVLKYAIKNEVLPIVVQGLINKDRLAKNAPFALKEKAASLIANY